MTRFLDVAMLDDLVTELKKLDPANPQSLPFAIDVIKALATSVRQNPPNGYFDRAHLNTPEVTPLEQLYSGRLEMAEDICRKCGAHIGFGIRALHLGDCGCQP